VGNFAAVNAYDFEFPNMAIIEVIARRIGIKVLSILKINEVHPYLSATD